MWRNNCLQLHIKNSVPFHYCYILMVVNGLIFVAFRTFAAHTQWETQHFCCAHSDLSSMFTDWRLKQQLVHVQSFLSYAWVFPHLIYSITFGQRITWCWFQSKKILSITEALVGYYCFLSFYSRVPYASSSAYQCTSCNTNNKHLNIPMMIIMPN